MGGVHGVPRCGGRLEWWRCEEQLEGAGERGGRRRGARPRDARRLLFRGALGDDCSREAGPHDQQVHLLWRRLEVPRLYVCREVERRLRLLSLFLRPHGSRAWSERARRRSVCQRLASIESMPTVSLTRLSDAHSGSARPTPTDDLNGPANAVRAPRDLAGGERGEEGDNTFWHGLSAVLATAAARRPVKN